MASAPPPRDQRGNEPQGYSRDGYRHGCWVRGEAARDTGVGAEAEGHLKARTWVREHMFGEGED